MEFVGNTTCLCLPKAAHALQQKASFDHFVGAPLVARGDLERLLDSMFSNGSPLTSRTSIGPPGVVSSKTPIARRPVSRAATAPEPPIRKALPPPKPDRATTRPIWRVMTARYCASPHIDPRVRGAALCWPRPDESMSERFPPTSSALSLG